MAAYEALAGAYDGLMADAQYEKRGRYVEKLLKKAAISVETVVDLGCGTGTIACQLAQRGYQVIAMDPSEEMLTQAMDKAMALDTPPQFLQQSMEKLRLPFLVDGVISTVDAMNYVTAPKSLQETFRRIYKHLNPGGRLVFDVNTPEKFQAMDGQMYVDETEEAYCVWRTFYSEKRKICTYLVDMFTQLPDGSYERTWEEHKERAYEQDQLLEMLSNAGFTTVSVFGDLTTQAPAPKEARIIFVCDKDK